MMATVYDTRGNQVTVYDTRGVTVWGAAPVQPDPTPGPAPEVDVSAMTVTRQVLPNTALQVGGFYPSAGTAQTYELTQKFAVDADTLVASVDASKDSGTLTLTINGTTHRATFGGSPKFTATGNVRPVFADPIKATVRAGDTVVTRLYLEATAEQHRSSKALDTSTSRFGPGDLTATSDGYTVRGNGNLPTIVSMTARTYPKSVAVLLLGDSIMESGSGSPTGYTRAVQAAGWAMLNAARWGGGSPRMDEGLIGLLDKFTHVLDQYGFNDLTKTSLSGVMAAKLAEWNWLLTANPALKITCCTVTPASDTTDNRTTLAGQTPWKEPVIDGLSRHERVKGYNNWLRDGAPILNGVATPGTTDPAAKRAGQGGHPLAGWVEVADAVESSRDSGIFRVDKGSISSDGAHMNSAGGDLIYTPVYAWAKTLTV